MPDTREHIGPITFLKYHAIQYYIVFNPISQRWRITYKIESFSYPDPDSDLHQNRIISSWSHTQHVHQGSSESIHNFLSYPAHKQTKEIACWARNCRNNFVISPWSLKKTKTWSLIFQGHQICLDLVISNSDKLCMREIKPPWNETNNNEFTTLSIFPNLQHFQYFPIMNIRHVFFNPIFSKFWTILMDLAERGSIPIMKSFWLTVSEVIEQFAEINLKTINI